MTLFQRIAFFSVLVLSLCFNACGPDDLFVEKTNLEGGKWVHSDSLSYTFELKDTSLLYNIYLLADYSDAYPFQNLYVRLRTTFPNGKSAEKVRSLDFFDYTGKAQGDCSGANCTLRSLLQESAFFNLPGPYTIEVIQNSRRDTLEGLKSMGLEVEQTKKNR